MTIVIIWILFGIAAATAPKLFVACALAMRHAMVAHRLTTIGAQQGYGVR